MMDAFGLSIILVACLVAVACVLPGVFLVLRGVALMSDAISHAILLGIAIMFLLVPSLNSPLLLIGATLAGVLTVIATEFLIYTQCLQKDAAISIIFPLFFSVGVILISRYARNIHLDIDMILVGEIAYAPFNRLYIAGYDVGCYAAWLLSGIIVINMIFITLFFKQLVLSIFDHDAAYLARYNPTLLYYGFMTIVSITAVGVFDSVGSIVVVALMIAPAATAFLLTTRVISMLYSAIGLALLSAIIGCNVALLLDVSIAGSVAVTAGGLFFLTFLCAPRKGVIARCIMQRRQRFLLAEKIVCYVVHERQHISIDKNQLCAYVGWKNRFTASVVRSLIEKKLIQECGKNLSLTNDGNRFVCGINK